LSFHTEFLGIFWVLFCGLVYSLFTWGPDDP